MELHYQVEVQDHINSQVQSQKRDNLLKCQYDSQNFDVDQVQMGCAEIESWFSKQHDS